MGTHKNRPTKEEYEEKKTQILKMFQDGIPMRRIEERLGMTQFYIKKIRDELIFEGRITKEEIKLAYDRYMKENPPAQGLDKRKVRQKSNTHKAEARHAKSLAKKEKTFELVNQRKSITDIANELQTTRTAIIRYIKQLVDENRLSPEEVEKIPKENDTIQVDKQSAEYIAQRDEVVKYLKLGWRTGAIRKKLEITPFYMDIYLRDIKKQKIMTSEEIALAKEKKKKQDLEDLENHIKSGKSIAQFREMKPEFTQNEATPLIKELIETGRITKEQVAQNRKNAAAHTMNEDVEMSPEDQKHFILDKIKAGYTPSEIVDSDETHSITMYKVLYQKRRFIEQGVVSQEEADTAMKKRQKDMLSQKHKAVMRLIIDYTKQGYNLEEITEKIEGYEYVTISKIKSTYEKEYGWFTADELKEFVRQRKIREFDALPQEEKDRIVEAQRQLEIKKEEERKQRQEDVIQKRQERKDKTIEMHKRDLLVIKSGFKKGIPVKKIADFMQCSPEYIFQLVKESKKNGTWLTQQELDDIEKLKERKRQQNIGEREKKKGRLKAHREAVQAEKRRQELWKLRYLATQGLTIDEIAEKMHYSKAYIGVLKRRATEEGLWFPEEELKNFKERRFQRKMAEVYPKELQQEKDPFEKDDKFKDKNALQQLNRRLEEYRRFAQKEDELEADGKENVSTGFRMNFINWLISIHKAGGIISEEDSKFMVDFYYIYPKLATKESIKALILNSGKLAGYTGVYQMTNELMSVLEESQYRDALAQYNVWARKMTKIPEMKALRKQGMSNTEIGNKYGMSSAEVVILLEENQILSFFGDKDEENR